MTTRFRLSGLGRTIAAGAILAGGLAARAEEPNERFLPEGLDITASATVANRYVAGMGAIIDKGPALQDLVKITFDEKYALGVWSSYDLRRGALHEVDVIGGVNLEEIEVKWPIEGKVSGRFGAQGWFYPSGFLGDKPDCVVTAGGHFSGPIELDVDYAHRLTGGKGLGGDKIVLTAEKPINLGGLTVTPGVSAAILSDFYGVSGHSRVTPSIGIGKKMNGGYVGVYGGYQLSLNNAIPETPVFGVTGSVNLDDLGRWIGNRIRGR